ncbi:hypothetical protein SAMN05444161_0668 [Rhizobiales bacterium GAS191]|jgi:hypothetical protein|nr:hypothetical protein SAMN05519103_08158 [Rhizobiales bacterium GAS113]SEC18607.1 hypothetical protein SAMN05444161_0668 [Rhizobiales bacterium GAS191]
MLREPAITTAEPPMMTIEDGFPGASPPYPVALSLVGARPPSSEPPAPALSAFLVTIDRLEQLIDQETLELRSLKPMDLREFNRRKSQGLLELSRAMRGLGERVRDDRVPERLTELRTKLDNNLSMLRMHLRAAQEVTSIIARAIQDAESDGTYSASVSTKSR